MWTDHGMENSDKLAVVIGRFQPFHNGHRKLLEVAKHCAKDVLVLIGSSDIPRSDVNPFTYEERRSMIKNSVAGIDTEPLYDHAYNDHLWIMEVQNIVNSYCEHHGLNPRKITLVGHYRDNSSWYLKKFPEWDLELVPEMEDDISGTDVRMQYYNGMILETSVPDSTYEFLEAFMRNKNYSNIVEEYKYNENYKKSWEKAPWPVNLVTVDNLVICNGKMLVVKRKNIPGKGLYALPGGYLETTERVIDGMMRELDEETSIDVSKEILKASIKCIEYFDNPSRSQRGRILTMVNLINLDYMNIPNVNAGDDAKEAIWISLGDFWGMRSKFFEDHYDIIEKMLMRTN